MNSNHTVEIVVLQPAPSSAELLSLLEAAYQNAHPTDWEMRVRNVLLNVLSHTDPADLSPDDKDRVYWLVKQTGLGDPDGWILGHRARLEAAAKEDRGPINKALTFDGFVFPTQFDRIRYIVTLVRDRPQWLENNPGKWRRIKDVQQEIAARRPRAESLVDLDAEPAGPNDQTSPGIQHHVDDKDDMAIVYRSSPNETTSAPPLAPETGEDGTTKSEAVPVDPTMSEATPPVDKIAPRAQFDAKAALSAPVKLGSPAEIDDVTTNRKSAGRDAVALKNGLPTTPAASPFRVAYGTTKAEVLSRAKAGIEAGESLRLTAERLACANEDFHASQREIGRAIGWSASKVNRLLTWRRSGYKQSSPFGPTTRAGRASRRKHRNGSGADGGSKQLDDGDGKVHSVGHRLPPDQPAPPPKSGKETLPSGSRQGDAVPSVKAATKETKASQAQTALPREKPHCERARKGSAHSSSKSKQQSPRSVKSFHLSACELSSTR
jgi:hypothetical protein